MLVFLFSFLFFGGCSLGENQPGSVRSILKHVQSYEITYPTWLHPHRHRRFVNKEVSQSDVDISQRLFSGT